MLCDSYDYDDALTSCIFPTMGSWCDHVMNDIVILMIALYNIGRDVGEKKLRHIFSPASPPSINVVWWMIMMIPWLPVSRSLWKVDVIMCWMIRCYCDVLCMCVWIFFRSLLYFYIDVYSVDRQLFQTVGMLHSLRYMVQEYICMCIYLGIETMAMFLLMIVYVLH